MKTFLRFAFVIVLISPLAQAVNITINTGQITYTNNRTCQYSKQDWQQAVNKCNSAFITATMKAQSTCLTKVSGTPGNVVTTLRCDVAVLSFSDCRGIDGTAPSITYHNQGIGYLVCNPKK